MAAAGEFPFGFLVLALPFLGALLAVPVARLAPRLAAALLALLPALAVALLLVGAAGEVAAGGTLLFGADWVPALGLRFSFRLDGLGFAFALLVTGIGALVIVYSGGYLAGDRRLGRFLGFMFLFMGAMLGLVLADDLVTLAVFWEATSITSFLLIGFDHERERARRGAIQALVITGGGGLALLAAVAILREGAGLASFSAVLASGDALREGNLYLPVCLLVLLAAFTKSAQVPFHVWLPNAMEAPTPVSAYLHSATMVKAGVYLLMRLNPALGGTGLWETALPLFGGLTLLVGAALALRQSDVKLVLAYTTVASLGLLVMLVGAGSEAALAAAVLYLLAHALFKGALFMVAGAIDHGAGTRDLGALGGLRAAMPLTFAAALGAALSMAGVTPFLGFLAKEELYAATIDGGTRGALLAAVALLGNAMMAAAAAIVALRPFLGHRPEGLRDTHEAGASLLVGPLALAAAGLLAGLATPLVHHGFAEPMAAAVAGASVAIAVSPVPHLNTAFALSLLTLALGALLFLFADRLRLALAHALSWIGWGPDQGFDQAIRALLRLASVVTGFFQSGRLDRYMTLAFAALALALLAPPLLLGGRSVPTLPPLPRFHEAIVAVVLGLGVYAVLVARNRLVAVVSLGIQGLGVALLFLFLGAPDLSFTQFMVETLSVVILALVMTRLKLAVTDRRPPREAIIDGALALGCGAGFALMLITIAAKPLDPALPNFFAENSYAVAHGRNIVNVILVDFRGVDTLGEIAVVLTAGLAILALLGLRPRRAAKDDGKAEARP